MPPKPGEQLLPVIENLAQQLNIDFFESEVEAVLCLSSKRNGISPVLVRFTSVATKEKRMQCWHDLQELAEKKLVPDIFFNDNLTAFNRKLFGVARKKGKEKSFKLVWQKNGKIFAKKSKTASFIRINSYSDLDLIVYVSWVLPFLNIRLFKPFAS